MPGSRCCLVADVVPYLPSLERVQANPHLAATLPAAAPSHVYGAAAIVLQIDGLRREAWTDDVELSERLFAEYPKGFPPAPDRTRPASYKVIDDEVPAVRQRCMNCVLRPGFSPCVRCGGTGVIYEVGDSPLMTRCPDCHFGFSRCTTCEGTTVSVRARVRYVNDSPVNLRQLFVPELPKTIRSYVEGQISASLEWPEVLRFEPEPAMVGTAYRGASAVREPDFHGFFFGDALMRTTGSIAQSTRDLVGSEVRAYGVAILWLVYEAVEGTSHMAFFSQPDGSWSRAPMV